MGWAFLMAAYYACIAYYAAGPDRVERWLGPALARARGRAGALAARGVEAAKGVNWRRYTDPESMLEVHL